MNRQGLAQTNFRGYRIKEGHEFNIGWWFQDSPSECTPHPQYSASLPPALYIESTVITNLIAELNLTPSTRCKALPTELADYALEFEHREGTQGLRN